MRAHTPSARSQTRESFAERWSGRLADLDGASFAEALAELADLRAARQEAEYYHYLAESTDSENAEIRDLGAWLEPRLTEIANVIRAFELEWIGLPADAADRLLGRARGGRRGACPEQAPPFRSRTRCRSPRSGCSTSVTRPRSRPGRRSSTGTCRR